MLKIEITTLKLNYTVYWKERLELINLFRDLTIR